MEIKGTSNQLLDEDVRETLTTVFDIFARRGRLLRSESNENDFIVMMNRQEESGSGEERTTQTEVQG